MGSVFSGAIDMVGRLVGVWMLYGVAKDYLSPLFYRATGKRELPGSRISALASILAQPSCG